jgi:hypothetical protein
MEKLTMTFLSKIFDKLGRRRVITERNSTEPYLIRFYVFLKDRKNFPFNITLHKVLKSDEPTLHDHPWNYSTLILKGGYYENTPEGRFWRGPGHFRFRKASDLHWLELPRDENGNEIPCWSLFYMGKKAQEWGFLKDGTWVHNEQYLARGAKGD